MWTLEWGENPQIGSPNPYARGPFYSCSAGAASRRCDVTLAWAARIGQRRDARGQRPDAVPIPELSNARIELGIWASFISFCPTLCMTILGLLLDPTWLLMLEIHDFGLFFSVFPQISPRDKIMKLNRYAI